MADHYQKFIDASINMLQLDMSIYLLLITAMAYLIYEHVRDPYKALLFFVPVFTVAYQGFLYLSIYGNLLDALAAGNPTRYTDLLLNYTLLSFSMTFQTAFILLTVANVVLLTAALILTRRSHG